MAARDIMARGLVFAFALAALAATARVDADGAQPVPPTPDPAPVPPDPAPVPPPALFPTAEQREGWVRMVDMPGVNVQTPDKAWTSPAVVEVMRVAGETALALGGLLQVNGVSGPDRGAINPPHVSHRWGRDLDIAYTLDKYPTEPATPVDARVVAVLQAIAPWVERVGVNASRAYAFQGAGVLVSEWEGHVGHLHLRLVRGLSSAAEPEKP